MYLRSTFIWTSFAAVILVPLVVAANSPLLAWREPVYIIAGFSGILALAILLAQPLLAGGYLPGLPNVRARLLHRWLGAALAISVLLHVAGLWITSPPDVVDVLLFRSPTPFSLWGVIGMWAVIAAAALAILRRRVRVVARRWKVLHTSLTVCIVITSVIHALLIEGTMGAVSKIVLCSVILVVTGKTVFDLTRRQPRQH